MGRAQRRPTCGVCSRPKLSDRFLTMCWPEPGPPTLWHRLTDHWRAEGIVIRRGVDPSDIRDFELEYAVTLPRDLCEYFLTIDGSFSDFRGGVSLDSWLMCFRALSDFTPLGDVSGCESHARAFVIADHDISSVLWGLYLDNEPRDVSGPVFRIGFDDPPGRAFALSFTAFVEQYLTDPASLLRPL